MSRDPGMDIETAKRLRRARQRSKMMREWMAAEEEGETNFEVEELDHREKGRKRKRWQVDRWRKNVFEEGDRWKKGDEKRKSFGYR